MKAHIDRTKGQLGDLAGMAAKTEQAERNILAAAEKRLAEVQSQLERSQPEIEAAPEADQDRYLSLQEERRQLEIVIGKAREILM